MKEGNDKQILIFGWIIALLLSSLFSLMIGAKWSRKSLKCLQLPNSGNSLNLMVPSDGLKAISVWTNYSCMVISQKMIKREMGNRGSKSMVLISKSIVVKEPRVYGNWLGWYVTPSLRCIIIGFKNKLSGQNPFFVWVLFPSPAKLEKERNQINMHTRRLYCHKVVEQSCREKPIQNLSHKMNPWFITGFVDGEGCLSVTIVKNKELKVGWRVQPSFQLELHRRDQAILEQTWKFFAVGKIYKDGPQALKFIVNKKKELKKLKIIFLNILS